MLTAHTPLPRRLPHSDAPTIPLCLPQTQRDFAELRRDLHGVQAPLLWMVDALGAILVRLVVCSLFYRHRYNVCTISARVLPGSGIVRQNSKNAWLVSSLFIISASRCGGRT